MYLLAAKQWCRSNFVFELRCISFEQLPQQLRSIWILLLIYLFHFDFLEESCYIQFRVFQFYKLVHAMNIRLWTCDAICTMSCGNEFHRICDDETNEIQAVYLLLFFLLPKHTSISHSKRRVQITSHYPHLLVSLVYHLVCTVLDIVTHQAA